MLGRVDQGLIDIGAMALNAAISRSVLGRRELVRDRYHDHLASLMRAWLAAPRLE